MLTAVTAEYGNVRVDSFHGLLVHYCEAHDIPVIVNIHNVALAQRFADRIIGMSKGEIVFDGPPQALQDAHLLQIYGGEGWLQ